MVATEAVGAIVYGGTADVLILLTTWSIIENREGLQNREERIEEMEKAQKRKEAPPYFFPLISFPDHFEFLTKGFLGIYMPRVSYNSVWKFTGRKGLPVKGECPREIFASHCLAGLGIAPEQYCQLMG